MSLYIHPAGLSPDPSYGRSAGRPVPGGRILTVYPHACLRLTPDQHPGWRRQLNLHTRPPSVSLRPDSEGRIDLLLDFGTELEAELVLRIRTASATSLPVFVAFGESIPEADGCGIPTTNPLSTVAWHNQGKGFHRNRFAARGFRFVRIQIEDARSPVEFIAISADAWIAFRERQGDFSCDNPRFQSLWQTSVYTARVCSRPDSFWDGVKRDRVGWFGDARITQMTADAVFADPAPALHMLEQLPTDRWTMGIPGYTFAAVAMLHQLILAHGTRHPAIPDLYRRMSLALQWAHRTQLNQQGLMVRDPDHHYFGRVAFVDWSPMPVGGQFEELSWLQCQHLEALRLATELAIWLNRPQDAARYSRRAHELARVIRRRFWRTGKGMIHTRSQTIREWKPLVVLPLPETVDNEYRRLYFRLPSIGESRPSRHSQTLAVWAGLVQTPADRDLVLRTLQSARHPVLITAYFRYFEAVARAECGDPTGALRNFVDYLTDQVEPNDSATLWEWHDPAVRGFQRWSLGDWPKSLCHGWSSGLVPLTQRYVLGIQPRTPGFTNLRINPTVNPPFAFQATVPTPFGPIYVQKDTARSKPQYTIPRGITLEPRLDNTCI